MTREIVLDNRLRQELKELGQVILSENYRIMESEVQCKLGQQVKTKLTIISEVGDEYRLEF